MTQIDEKAIEERVMKVVGLAFHKDVNLLSEDTRFIEDISAKSINLVGLVALVEKEFGVTPSFVEIVKVKKIRELIDLVVSLLER